MKTKIKILLSAAALLLAAACSKDESPDSQAKLSQYARDYLAVSLYIEQKNDEAAQSGNELKSTLKKAPAYLFLKSHTDWTVDTIIYNPCNGYEKDFSIPGGFGFERFSGDDLACLKERTLDPYVFVCFTKMIGWWDNVNLKWTTHFNQRYSEYKREDLTLFSEESFSYDYTAQFGITNTNISYSLVSAEKTLRQTSEKSTRFGETSPDPDANSVFPYIYLQEYFISYFAVTEYNDKIYTPEMASPCIHTAWYTSLENPLAIITSGTIKVNYRQGENTGEFIIDYGQGELDTRVTIIENGVYVEVDLADIQLFNPRY